MTRFVLTIPTIGKSVLHARRGAGPVRTFDLEDGLTFLEHEDDQLFKNKMIELLTCGKYDFITSQLYLTPFCNLPLPLIEKLKPLFVLPKSNDYNYWIKRSIEIRGCQAISEYFMESMNRDLPLILNRFASDVRWLSIGQTLEEILRHELSKNSRAPWTFEL